MDKNSFSRPIVRIAIISTALGLSVMIISIAVVRGFQQQISDKVIGFGSHIQINKYDFNTSYEASPISLDQEFYPDIKNVSGIKHIQKYAYKLGIIKTYTDLQGIILKGVGEDYNWEFFKRNIVAGNIPDFSDNKRSLDVLISKHIADKLNLSLGDNLRTYFVSPQQKNLRGRNFKIIGIYETGLYEFDKEFIVGDIKNIQKLNRWEDHQIGGFEILVDDFNRLDDIIQTVYKQIGYNLDATSIKHVYPQLFEWIDLMDVNAIVILTLMVIVAGITMISILLIIIIERSQMIGILKSMGANNLFVRKVFLYKSMHIILHGLLWGNLIGIGFCVMQYYFGIIKLDQESYYMSVVPININLFIIILINIGTTVISTLMLLIPSMIIGKMNPAKTIRLS